ncbi:putative acetyltransferase [compost metagenome]
MNHKFNPATTVTINWCTDVTYSEALTQLFVAHAHTQYISHSELQGSRAISPVLWRSDLASTVGAELRATLAQDPADADHLVAVARIDDAIAGMALLSIGQRQDIAVPYASLDDLIVHPDYRGAGVGRQLIAWLEQAMLARGISRLFLESGIGNHDAHRFFHDQGFQDVSVVMMKELSHA